MDAAGAVDAQNAPTAPWKTAHTAVSHSAHSHQSLTIRRGSVLVSEGGQKILSLDRPDGYIAAGILSSLRRAGGLIVFDADGTRVLAEPLAVTGREITSVRLATDGRIAAGLSADSRAGTNDGLAIFDIDINSWKRKAVRTANRNFTRSEWMQFFPEIPYRRTSRSLPWPHDLPEGSIERKAAEAYELDHPDHGVRF
jgi:hypothetical protein